MKHLLSKVFLLGLCAFSIVPAAYCQWVQQPFPTNEDLWKVRFIDSTTGWVLGANYVYKTTNGGTSWSAQTAAIFGSALQPLDRNVVFFSDTAGIHRTGDGGATWTTVDASSIYCTDFEFLNSRYGLASGGWLHSNNLGVVKRTTDGGITWRTIAQVPIGGSGVDFEGVSFIDSLNGWAVAYYAGQAFHSTDGGNTWIFQDSLGRSPEFTILRPVRDIQFTTSDSGWAVGGLSGLVIIARTTDGGKTWSHQGSNGPSLREIRMLDSHLGWFVGANDWGGPAKTTNGGETWLYQSYSPFDSRGFESISIISQTLGWVVGQGGRVARTTNGGGVASVGQNGPTIPSMSRLEQNYPNPFNPSTVIGYRVSGIGFGWVNLSVSDILGREVATLVNERKAPGYYEVTFSAKGGSASGGDASGLASGVYFYRLIAGQFIETRKLILVK